MVASQPQQPPPKKMKKKKKHSPPSVVCSVNAGNSMACTDVVHTYTHTQMCVYEISALLTVGGSL